MVLSEIQMCSPTGHIIMQSEMGHTANYAFRYFDISSNDTGIDTSVLDDTSVMIYWESEMGADTMAKNNTPLTIQVTCTKGKQKQTITSYYTLEMEDVTETSYSDVDGSIGGDDTGNSYVNPSNNIYEYPVKSGTGHLVRESRRRIMKNLLNVQKSKSGTTMGGSSGGIYGCDDYGCNVWKGCEHFSVTCKI